MIIMDLQALRAIGPGMYKSMGTGGLKPEEVRALHFRLDAETWLPKPGLARHMGVARLQLR